MQHAAGSTLHATCDMRQRVCQMQTKLILAKVNLWHNSFKLPAPGIGIMNEQSNEQQVSTAATPILPTIRPPPSLTLSLSLFPKYATLHTHSHSR